MIGALSCPVPVVFGSVLTNVQVVRGIDANIGKGGCGECQRHQELMA